MKKLSIILSLLILFLSCKGNDNKTSDSTSVKSVKKEKLLKRYKIKSGIVTYTSTIAGEVMGSVISGTGTENLHFKDWGALELREEKSKQTTQTNIFGQKSTQTTESHTMYKLDHGDSYQVNFDTKEITKQKDMAMEMIKNLHEDSNAGDVGRSILENMGGKVIGNEKFLGYDCEIWEIMGAKQWIHKNVMLKLEMEVMGIKTLKQATSVKFNVKIPSKTLALPDYPIVETENILDTEEYKEGMEDMKKIGKMSFEEWKEMALADDVDNEMTNMSDEELRKTYDMMQQMIKLQGK